MQERFDITFEKTREDILAFSQVQLREDPAWEAAKSDHQRSMRRQALYFAPFIVAGVSYWIGRDDSTQGMYWEGAALGAVFAAFLFFALPRLNDIEKTKKARMKQLLHMDLSEYTGTEVFAADEQGVSIQARSMHLKLPWRVVNPVARSGFVLLEHHGNEVAYIPHRCFATPQAADAFLEQAQRWHQAAQLPHAQRLKNYLADRDFPCPKCKYNLRGIATEACPECGEPLVLDALLGYSTDPKPTEKQRAAQAV